MTFCSHSTDESIQNEQISKLAIFEIFISIAIYWGIASYFDYYYHIYFSLAVAPLFLLRTQKSEKEALEFFAHFLNGNEKSFAKYLLRFLVSLCVVVLISFITYYAISFLTINYQEFDLLWRMFVLGIAVIGLGVMGIAVVGVVIATKIVIAVGKEGGIVQIAVVVVGAPILIFTISLIKIFCTLKNIFDGCKQIPYNWHKLIVYQDMYYRAEIMPGINNFNGLNDFKFIHLKSEIIDSEEKMKYRISSALLLVMLYAPTILYRISLKSTSLFYGILFIYPFRINKKYDNKRIKEVIKEQEIYFWFPVIMIAIFLPTINTGFDPINSYVEYMKGTLFYSSIKYFLSYLIVSSIICFLIWFIAKMFLIGDEDSSEGFYRMLLNGLFKLLKLSFSISAMLYMYYLYNLFNVSDVIKIAF